MNITLDAGQKALLTRWILQHAEAATMSGTAIAVEASEDLGFPISPMSPIPIRNAFYPEAGGRAKNNGGTLCKRIRLVEERLDAIEKYLPGGRNDLFAGVQS